MKSCGLSFRDCFHLITQTLSPSPSSGWLSTSHNQQPINSFSSLSWSYLLGCYCETVKVWKCETLIQCELFIGVLLYLSWSGVGHLRAGRNRVEGPSAPYPHLPVIYCGHTIIPSILCPATFAQMFPTKYSQQNIGDQTHIYGWLGKRNSVHHLGIFSRIIL